MMRRVVVLLVVLCLFPEVGALAQGIETGGQGKLVDTDGTRVHIFGLKTEQPQQLIKDIRNLHPSQPLGACMVDLKGPLGYPDALVMYYPVGTDHFGGVLIAVVDPQDSGRVSYRAKPELEHALPTRWKDIPTPSMLGSSLQAVFGGYALLLAGKESEAIADVRAYGVSEVNVKRSWRGLRNKTLHIDRDLATYALAYDGNETHRVVAAAVLMNFYNADATWQSLVEALRDPNDGVKLVAQLALRGFLGTGREIHRVDWQPSETPLRHLLAGTNPSAYLDLLDVLRETEIEPLLAQGLLQESNDLLGEFLDADRYSSSDARSREADGSNLHSSGGYRFLPPKGSAIGRHSCP